MAVEAFTPEPPAEAAAGALALPVDHAVAEASALGRADARRRTRALAPLGSLVLLDVVIVLALFAVTAALGLRFVDERWAGSAAGPFHAPALLAAALVPVAVALLGGYRRAATLMAGGLVQLGRLALSVSIGLWVTWVIGAVLGWSLSLEQFALVGVSAPLGMLAVRAWPGVTRARPERTLLLGSGRVAEHVIELTRRHPERNIEIVGCLDDSAIRGHESAPPVAGTLEDLEGLLDTMRIDRVIVCFSYRGDEYLMGVLRACRAHGVPVDVVPRLFDIMGAEPRAWSLGSLPLLSASDAPPSLAERAAKRTFDIILSGAALFVAAPIMAAVALAVLIDDGRPILYRQERIGRGGRTFSILKVRTMVRNADQIGMERIADLTGDDGLDIEAAVAALKQERDPRITCIGAFLRKTSLDELPQLINVLKGDMSLVGPRPLRPFEVDALDDWQRARHDVRPGITGLWQVLGRSEVRWGERMQMDYRYARHWSLGYDLRIIARTVAVVVAKRGAF
jgi:exopolysaccharide biosynthesis polyprenyl glycosylphosphotransferase